MYINQMPVYLFKGDNYTDLFYQRQQLELSVRGECGERGCGRCVSVLQFVGVRCLYVSVWVFVGVCVRKRSSLQLCSELMNILLKAFLYWDFWAL